MVCGHKVCEDLRHQGKKVVCGRNSRRLREARKHILDFLGDFSQRANALTPDVCGNVDWVHEGTSLALRKVVAELTVKTTWLRRVPWLMAEADDPDQAREIVRQLQNADESKLDALALEHKQRFMADLQVLVVCRYF